MQNILREHYRDFDAITVDRIRYQSNGHWVNGFLAFPKVQKSSLPVIIFNRGGSFEFGAIDDAKIGDRLVEMASWGYVVIASQYSGNGGSEGKDEIGGVDVDDVLILRTYLDQISEADTSRIGMVGGSRGGLMTYLVLARKVDWLKAAVVSAGINNMDRWLKFRPEIADVLERAFGNTEEGRRKRSPIHEVINFPKTVPILLMHGTGDRRVNSVESLYMSMALFRHRIPYRSIVFEGSDHALTEHRAESRAMTRQWLDWYVRDLEELPNLEPHGK